MNIGTVNQWLTGAAKMLTLVAMLGGVGVWAGDSRWITYDRDRINQIQALDLRITEIEIKIRNDEATRSEQDFVEVLRLHKRTLENE